MPDIGLISLATGLGAAVAKALLRAWAPDGALAESVIDVLADYSNDPIQRYLRRRHLTSQTDRIADRVGVSVFEILDREHRTLNEGEKAHVLTLATQAILAEPITPIKLLRVGGDPLSVAEELARRVIAREPMSEPESAALLRIIKRAHEVLAHALRQTPEYSAAGIERLLESDDKIITIVSTALEEIRAIREVADASSDARRAHSEEEYRLAVLAKMNRLQLLGLENNVRALSLTTAYVDLSFADKSVARSDEEVDEVSRGRKRISVESALASHTRMLIVGEAGCGKTTLLQWIALRATTGELTKQPSQWRKRVPFVIQLRQFAMKPLPRVEDLASLMSKSLASEPMREWALSVFKSDRAILLVDGLDEIAESRRLGDVHEWVHEVLTAFPRTPIVMTARPTSVDTLGWPEELKFQRFDVDKMSREQVSKFIRLWHKAVRETLDIDEDGSEFDGLPTALEAHLHRHPALYLIATTPLLCAVLCAVHRLRKGELPRERAELYETCCRLLLVERDIRKGVDTSDAPPLTANRKVSLLQELAYWLVRNGLVEARRKSVEDKISKFMSAMPRHQRTPAKTILKHLLLRSGLLREPEPGVIDFVHRTFLEYLAAREIVAENDAGLLIKHAANDMWREVIVLACAEMKRTGLNAFVADLLKNKSVEDPYIELLASECANVATAPLDASIRREIGKRLTKRVPPQDGSAAMALVKAGDLAVPHLAWAADVPEHSCALSAYALWNIGTPAALELLRQYAMDTRESVRDEVCQGWERVDRHWYAENILTLVARSPSGVRLVDIESLEGIERVAELRNLIVESRCGLSLDPLAGCKHLEKLEIHEASIECGRSLRASEVCFSSVSTGSSWRESLPPMPRCRKLVLRDVGDMRDLWALAYYVSRVKIVRIDGCSSLENIDGLVDCHLLEEVALMRVPYVLDCRAINRIKSLKRLVVDSSVDPDVVAKALKRGVVVTTK